MNTIEWQIRKAQRRLWLNRWLRQWGWSLLLATSAWTLAWLADRLFALKLPMTWIGLGGLITSLAASVIWLLTTREQAIAAAVALDQAANLRERLSTSLFVRQNKTDPFAQAAVADAERAAGGLSAKTFFPIRWAPSLSLSAAMLVVAALSLLLPEFDLLGGKQAKANEANRINRAKQIQATLAKPVSVLEEIASKNPDLDASKDLQPLEGAMKPDQPADPDVLRREVAKKLDRLQDSLKQKSESDRFQALDEAKKRLKQVGQLSDPKSELNKLLESISTSDFDQAQQEIKQLQEKLAKRAKEGGADAKDVEQMRKQLDEIAQKLQKAGEDRQSEQELKNAGMSEAEAKRMLDALAKKDPKQIEKLAKELAEKLKDKGMDEEKAKGLLNKIQQRQQAGQQCKQMGDKMANAAKQLERGDNEAAASEMGEAGEMLNDMEQLEEGLKDIQSQMAKLDQARDDMNNNPNDSQCKQCNGSGFRKDGSPCPSCQGDKSGPPGQGRGFGNRPRDDSAQTASVDKKGKTKTSSKGRIIGQQFVQGQQLKGQSQVELGEAASAAEIDAVNALDKDRIPRAYRKAVSKYFERLGDRFKPADNAKKKDAKQDGAEKEGSAEKPEASSEENQ